MSSSRRCVTGTWSAASRTSSARPRRHTPGWPHPTIIGVRDCEYADPVHAARPYLVMDYFPGGALEEFVSRHGPLSPPGLTAVAVAIASAMQAAHAKGILHRDLKPANVLVRKEGDRWFVKVIDFGLALRTAVLQSQVSTLSPQARTTTGRSLAGTLHYAAPEQMGQLPGVPVGSYSDVYGFGKTCYYALTGDSRPG